MAYCMQLILMWRPAIVHAEMKLQHLDPFCRPVDKEEEMRIVYKLVPVSTVPT